MTAEDERAGRAKPVEPQALVQLLREVLAQTADALKLHDPLSGVGSFCESGGEDFVKIR